MASENPFEKDVSAKEVTTVSENTMGNPWGWGLAGLVGGYILAEANGGGFGFNRNNTAVDEAVVESAKSDIIHSNDMNSCDISSKLSNIGMKLAEATCSLGYETAKQFNAIDASILNSKYETASKIDNTNLYNMSQFNQTQNAISNGFGETNLNMVKGNYELSSQLASCCCENKLLSKDTQQLIVQEGCSTRATMRDQGDRIVNQIQGVMDWLQNDKIRTLENDNLYYRIKSTSTTTTTAA